MRNCIYIFLEVYCETDSLIKKKLDSKIGFAEYINKMEECNSSLKQNNENWGLTLYNLKKIKSLHGQLMHCETFNFDEKMIDNYTDFINSFKSKLISNIDPLTVLKTKEENLNQSSKIKKMLKPNALTPTKCIKRIHFYLSALIFATSLYIKSKFDKFKEE